VSYGRTAGMKAVEHGKIKGSGNPRLARKFDWRQTREILETLSLQLYLCVSVGIKKNTKGCDIRMTWKVHCYEVVVSADTLPKATLTVGQAG